jgi:hypothetical protein
MKKRSSYEKKFNALVPNPALKNAVYNKKEYSANVKTADKKADEAAGFEKYTYVERITKALAAKLK